jgi:hypothetical protein
MILTGPWTTGQPPLPPSKTWSTVLSSIVRRLLTFAIAGDRNRKALLAERPLSTQRRLQRRGYDVYLEHGFPIASGVIEGACRCVVKDYMERSGMRWVM